MRRSFAIVALAGVVLAGPAWAQDCAVTIEGNDMIQFNQKELRVKSSCSEVTVTLKHTGMLAANVMGHNWVLTKTSDYQPVATAGQGSPPNYVPQGDARVIASTDVIGGGQETSVKVDVSKLMAGADYTFFCSFPGHFVLMNGKFIVE
jgi:azurin